MFGAIACQPWLAQSSKPKKALLRKQSISFDMWKVYIHVTVLELCVSKMKKEKEEEERRLTKSKFFMFVFLSFCMG